MKSVRIIKRSKNEILTELPTGQDNVAGQPSTREMAKTVKGWIAELRQGRRDEQRANSVFGKIR